MIKNLEMVHFLRKYYSLHVKIDKLFSLFVCGIHLRFKIMFFVDKMKNEGENAAEFICSIIEKYIKESEKTSLLLIYY